MRPRDAVVIGPGLFYSLEIPPQTGGPYRHVEDRGQREENHRTIEWESHVWCHTNFERYQSLFYCYFNRGNVTWRLAV